MLTFIGKFRLTYIIKEKAERLTKGVDQHVVVHIANRFGYKLKIDGCNGNDFEDMIEDDLTINGFMAITGISILSILPLLGQKSKEKWNPKIPSLQNNSPVEYLIFRNLRGFHSI